MKKVKIQPRSSVWCEQSENIERFRVNEVSGQFFSAGRKIRPLSKDQCLEWREEETEGHYCFISSVSLE